MAVAEAVAEAAATPVAVVVERVVVKVVAKVIVALSVQLSRVHSWLVCNCSARNSWVRKYSVQRQPEHKHWERKLLVCRT